MWGVLYRTTEGPFERIGLCRMKRLIEFYHLLIAVAILAFFYFDGPCCAEMREMNDDHLGRVTAQAGLTIFTDLKVTYDADIIKISDSDLTDWIEFQGFSVHDGSDEAFSINTPDESPITFDVGTLASGQTVAQTFSSLRAEPRYYSIDSLVFCDTALGSIDIDHVVQAPSTLMVGAHADGSTGIDLSYATAIDIDAFQYTYNDAVSFSLSGIHLYGSATGNAEDPATWEFSGQFQIGNLETDPATIDIATDASDQTTMEIGLPMQGTLRIENIQFGDISLGPCTIDGLTVHRMSLSIIP